MATVSNYNFVYPSKQDEGVEGNTTLISLFDDLWDATDQHTTSTSTLCSDAELTSDNRSSDLKIDFKTTEYGVETTPQTLLNINASVSNNDSISQKVLFNYATEYGSNIYYPLMGNNLQQNTLNYALTSSLKMQSEANLACTSTLEFANKYINEFNLTFGEIYTDATVSNPLPTISSIVSSVADIELSSVKLDLQITTSEGDVIGDLLTDITY